MIPFSVRAIENAPVATPLYWDELDNTVLNAQFYNINTIFKRVGVKGNLRKNFNQNPKGVGKAIRTLEELINYQKQKKIPKR